MKHVIRITMMLLLVPMVASAQWEFAGVFPDSTAITTSHGLAVDSDNKLWNAPYYGRTDIEGFTRVNTVQVWNEDGTEADFSPLFGSVTGDSTLYFGALTGITAAPNGHIYVSSHGFRSFAEGAANPTNSLQYRSFIHVFDMEGNSIDVVEITVMNTATIAHAPNRVGVTEDGFVVVGYVLGGTPVRIYDPADDWAQINEVTTEKFGISRSLEVSNDGTKIFFPQNNGFDGGQGGFINVYESSSVFDEYETASPLAIGPLSGAIQRYPNSNIVYFSGAGIGNDPDAPAPWISSSFYGVSLESGQAVDEFTWNFGEATLYRIPRALAFSPDGLTAYVGSFSAGSGNIQKFTRAEPVSIDRGVETPDGFALEQNYPNPFNPTTSIRYSVGEAGMTTLRVYDMLGRVVATLVNQEMPAGTHNVMFNATQLGSGVYLYELTSGNVRLTNKMTLVK